jgi:hypothetical protein
MIELIRTDDPVLLSWLETRLAEAGIRSVTLDTFTSHAFAGTLDSVGRRVMVSEADVPRAREIVREGRALAARS